MPRADKDFDGAGERSVSERPRRANRGGRPRTTSPRAVRITIRLTVAERDALSAKTSPGDLAEFIRRAALGKRAGGRVVVPAVNASAWAALAPLIADIKLIATEVAAEQHAAAGLGALIDDLRVKIITLRSSLIGGAR